MDPINSGSTADLDRDSGDPGDPGDEPVEEDLSGDPVFFACHFQKRDHIKYGAWNKKYAMCSCCHMEELRRIKRHFETVHRLRQCERCYRLFPDRNKLHDHRREPEGCLIRELDLKEGIDDPQWDEIKVVLSAQGRRRINDVARWYAIWKTLFPGVEEPSNPWRELPPTYVARPATNVEDYVSEFKRRVYNDIKKRIIPALEERVLERFLEDFRQVWKEELATRGLIQNQPSCSNEEDPRINNESFEHKSGEFDSMDQNEATGAPGSAEASTRIQSMDNLNQAQAQATSDSTYHDQNWPRLDLNAEFSEHILNEFYGYMDSHSLECPTSPQGEEPQISALETNPLSERVIFGHDMGDDFLTEFLQAENERLEVMAAWKDKNSGNRVLRQL